MITSEVRTGDRVRITLLRDIVETDDAAIAAAARGLSAAALENAVDAATLDKARAALNQDAARHRSTMGF